MTETPVTRGWGGMPGADQILEGATRIANEALPLAVAWHAMVAVGSIALVAGWRPSRRTAALLLTLPLASVSALAFAYGNPFNGTVFAAAVLLSIVLARRLGREPVEAARGWSAAAGIVMVSFGWIYPHFLRTDSALAYLVAAPTGLVPCPSLSLVIGFALLGRGLGDRAWSGVLAAIGLLYGVVGVAKLHVLLDLPLVAGAAALAFVALWPEHARRARRAIDAHAAPSR